MRSDQRKTSMNTTKLAAVISAGLLTTAVAGCGADEPQAAPKSDQPQSSSVTIDRQWVKAVDEGTTAAFGTLHNDSRSPVRLTSATSPASSVTVLHETEDGGDGGIVMRKKKGGFTIPADGKRVFAPGGDHIMLMDVKEPIRPGDRVRVALVFRDGSRLRVTAPARSFSGAKETYRPGDGGE